MRVLQDSWDEIMIVKYKNRFQFLKMAMLTPTYWPLAYVYLP